MNFDVIECSGADAVSQWKQLRNRWQPGEQYPFLIGEQSHLDTLRELADYDKRTTAAIIAESLQLNLVGRFAECAKEQQESYEEDEEFDEASLLGEWPEQEIPKQEITIHCDLLTGAIKRLIYIGLAKLDEPWMLPAVVRYGGWNACPEATMHCAIMRHWQQTYGAEIVTMASDIIECRVQHPPTTKDEAIKLAWEQFWYCDDIVMQGVGDIMTLAAGLLNSNNWFFWWD